MKQFTVNGNLGKFNVNLPTDLNEIPVEYLVNSVNHLTPAPEYSLVALAYREKLAIVLNSAKENKNLTTAVVPIFIKTGETESDYIKGLNAGEPLVVTGSDLALGIQVNSPVNSISINNIVAICNGDKEIYTEALKDSNYYYFIEFKLIRNCDIHGTIATTFTAKVDEQFVVRAEDTSAQG